MIQKLLITVGFIGIVFGLFSNADKALGVETPQTFTQNQATVQCVNGLPQVSLSWGSVDKALYYKIQRKNVASAPWSGILDSQIKTTSHVDKRFKSDYGAMKFQYRIIAQKEGSLVYSTEVSVAVPECRTKPAPAPTAPAPVATTTPSTKPATTTPVVSPKPPVATSTATTTPVKPPVTPVATTSTSVASSTGKMPAGVKWGAYTGWHASSMTEFEALTKKKPEMEMVFVHWGNETTFPSYYAGRIRDQGRTMVLFWEASDFKRDAFSQPEYSYDSVLAGKLDSYFKTFAEGAKAYGGPVILIPYSEFNGNWYPWGITIGTNTAEKHKAAYRYIHNFFKDVPNVKFGWAPNAGSVPNTPANQFELAYPGDDVVDYVGIDAFNFGGGTEERSPSQLLDGPLAKLKTYKKPIYLFSMATAAGTGKAAWIKDFLTVQLYKYPEVKGWLWFNQNKERDWRVNSDAASLSTFVSALP
ncbi:MAG: hypothetical protein KBD50_00325 [Candidatus Pacebacteria bacterium]|nr:hypothetical protein [Candidatus Paceibacterota bacterium]